MRIHLVHLEHLVVQHLDLILQHKVDKVVVLVKVEMVVLEVEQVVGLMAMEVEEMVKLAVVMLVLVVLLMLLMIGHKVEVDKIKLLVNLVQIAEHYIPEEAEVEEDVLTLVVLLMVQVVMVEEVVDYLVVMQRQILEVEVEAEKQGIVQEEQVALV